MPLQKLRQPQYRPQRRSEIRWDTFRRGLNTLLREVELKDDELARADNLMLVGSGVPTKRWGSTLYFLAGESGALRGLQGYYKSDGTNELLALSDWGYLTKKSGASYTMLTGASWASGYDAQLTQLNDKMYIVNGVSALARYNGATITTFTRLSVPTNLTATNISGASGTFTYSWRVSAENDVGETSASNAITLANLPQDLSNTSVRISWTTASPASSVKGYVIYGRSAGNETFLGRVEPSSLTFIDSSTNEPAVLAEPLTADTTGGPIAKYIRRFDNRLVLAGISGEPSRVIFSGKASNAEKFHWSQGGGYIDIDTDSGDNITGLDTTEDRIIVFKEKSIWQVTISSSTFGNYTIATPVAKLITRSYGAVSAKTICAAENDIMFLSRSGVYVLGYEPNILNVLRTNELSAKIRPFFKDLTTNDLSQASAEYLDKKYILSFPTTKKTVVYDRERLAWMGPWPTPNGINNWHKYYDPDGIERWIAGQKEYPKVDEFSTNYSSDSGVDFNTLLRTKKDNFKDWANMKVIEDAFTYFKNTLGNTSVRIYIEDVEGNNVAVSAYTISSLTSSSNAIWGSSQWGNNQWGDSEAHGSAITSIEITKLVYLDTVGRSVQVEVQTSTANDNYELLGIRIKAKPLPRYDLPTSSWLVS